MTLYKQRINEAGLHHVEATDADVLAKPCVVAALVKAREETFTIQWQTDITARANAEWAAHPDLQGQTVRQVRHITLTNKWEKLTEQVVRSLSVGTHRHGSLVIDVVADDYEVVP